MSATLGNTLTAKTAGQISELSSRTQDRIGTARHIAHRIQELRVRLIGDSAESKAEADKVPEPVRPEVDDLSHNLNVLGDLLNEIESDLQALEGL